MLCIEEVNYDAFCMNFNGKPDHLHWCETNPNTGFGLMGLPDFVLNSVLINIFVGDPTPLPPPLMRKKNKSQPLSQMFFNICDQ